MRMLAKRIFRFSRQQLRVSDADDRLSPRPERSTKATGIATRSLSFPRPPALLQYLMSETNVQMPQVIGTFHGSPGLVDRLDVAHDIDRAVAETARLPRAARDELDGRPLLQVFPSKLSAYD